MSGNARIGISETITHYARLCVELHRTEIGFSVATQLMMFIHANAEQHSKNCVMWTQLSTLKLLATYSNITMSAIIFNTVYN